MKTLITHFCSSISDCKLPRQCPPELRTFALTLHFYSPKAYEYVRSKFNFILPHQKTISKWYGSINGEPGICAEAFWILEQKVTNSPEKVVVALIIDEMNIRQDIHYNGKIVEGYVDLGCESDVNTDLVAKEALVFLVSSMNERWKIPVAYFFINSLTGLQKSKLLLDCIRRLQSIGVVVSSLTFDGLQSNIAMANHLGCCTTYPNIKPSFEVDEKLIALIYDPCHMIKLVRNTFGEKQVMIDYKNRIISWQYIVELNKLQTKEGLNFANRLRTKHVQYKGQKMKVHLATQLFSKSVADALKTCRKMGLPQFQGSEGTEEFIQNVNDTFDVLNARHTLAMDFKRALDPSTYKVLFVYICIEKNTIIFVISGRQNVCCCHGDVLFAPQIPKWPVAYTFWTKNWIFGIHR